MSEEIVELRKDIDRLFATVQEIRDTLGHIANVLPRPSDYSPRNAAAILGITVTRLKALVKSNSIGVVRHATKSGKHQRILIPAAAISEYQNRVYTRPLL